MEADSAVVTVRLGIESHRGLLLKEIGNYEHPKRHAREGASMSINAFEPTVASALAIPLRHCRSAAAQCERWASQPERR